MASQSSELDAVMGMLASFAVVGTLGNALTLYVFSKMLNSKQHVTSTIFILTLAGTDFITSGIIIPYTMYMEHQGYHVSSELVCKCYFLLSTSTVPYSAFIMVAIAVDRYICICHPFSQAMTTFRAKTVIICLACLAGGMGIITCLFYTVQPLRPTDQVVSVNSSTISVSRYEDGYNSSGTRWESGRPVASVVLPGDPDDDSEGNFTLSYKTIYHSTNITSGDIIVMLTCGETREVFGKGFQKSFQFFSSSLFLVVLVTVSILYSLIYRRVLQRRKAHPHIFSNYWCFCIPKPGMERNQGTINENGLEDNNERRSLRSPSVRSPNARADKVFLANLKIAVTLFVVTVVFVAAYLPAWLMALDLIPENIIVFYTYFTHNILNPLVYAFMNQTFRQHLAEIGKCTTPREST